ncbi:MAG: 23S rRNA (guanosine(2251)-2'-O)-methyltransferase RlmB, partial [Desulfovibrio sp.]|nr:23S rRNA (guanosine(2251)-2'-O)-methyltransferase RlmB [Desulfovibrio sp.]
MAMREHKNQDQSPKRTLTLSDAAEFSEPLDAHRLLPGLKPVLEALTEQPESLDLVLVRANLAGKELKQLQSLCQAAAIRLRKVPEEALARLCREDGQNPKIAHQGVIARITKTSFVSLDELLPKVAQAPLPLLVALDQVKDPGNLGAITRTLYTLGGAGLLVPLHNSAALGPQARRTAAGALDKLPIAKVTN